MAKYVYVDMYFLENMVLNYVLLHITSRILRFEIKWYRLFAGSICGAIYALCTIWVESSVATMGGKIFISVVMIIIAFSKQISSTKGKFKANKREKFLTTLNIAAVFYIVTFVFAGASFAFLLAGNTKSMTRYIIGIYMAYFLITFIVKYIKNKRSKDVYKANVYIQFEKEKENGEWYSAIIDTGNSLKDPFTGESVIVAEIENFKDMLPFDILEYLKNIEYEDMLNDSAGLSKNLKWKKRFRIIPYKAVGTENGILPGFKADVVRIESDYYPENIGKENSKTIIELNNITICIYKNSLSTNNEYSILISPDMVA